MRKFLLVLALSAPTTVLAEDTAAIQTDPVLRVREARGHLDTLRARLSKMRQKGETWQGRFDQSVGMKGSPVADEGFKPIFNPPTGKENAPALRTGGDRLITAAAGIKALKLQGKAADAVADFEQAVADLGAADGPAAAQAALDRAQAALEIISPR